MPHRNPRNAISLIEALVALAAAGVLVALILVAVQMRREQDRKARCLNNLRNLGTALHNYEGSFKAFPSASLVKPGTTTLSYSWLVQILPQIEVNQLLDPMKISTNTDPSANTAGRQACISLYRCPAYSGPEWADARSKPPMDWITNYKAMGATSQASLAFWPGSGHAGKPPYGDESMHPDGVMYPNKKTKISELIDGTTETIMVVETIEQQSAIWYRGDTATLTGFPDCVTFAPVDASPPYYAPTGFTRDLYYSESTIVNNITYLGWDYLGTGEHAGYYASGSYRVGLSSGHAGVVMHLFGDAQARPIAKTIDAAIYMFMITRTGKDPSCITPPCCL